MLTSSHFDLAIIGGGPAGTATAITAARLGARVGLFEAHDFPRHKVCGEFLSGEALETLVDLLGNEVAAVALMQNAPVINRARLWLGNRYVETAVSPPGISVLRYDLDLKLWEAAQAAGVDCRVNCEVSATYGDGPFHLRTNHGSVSTETLIVAAGRWSQFTHDRTVLRGPKWIGLKAYFRERDPNPDPSTDLYFFDRGYCGVQPVANDVVNACAMVRADVATSLADVFRVNPQLTLRSHQWIPLTQTFSTAPLIHRPPTPVRDKVAFVGDAAAFIDPFVGDGISIALRSGRVAAQCLSEFVAARSPLGKCIAAYQAEYSRRFAPLLITASRARRLTMLPVAARAISFELLRLPGLIPLVIRKTRQVA
jgi:menaquinone-9 beta-reductase